MNYHEKRRSPRQKSLLRALVYFDGVPNAIEATVRDMSQSGARLRFLDVPPEANALEFKLPLKGTSHKAKVIWRASCEIGVAFQGLSAKSQPEEEATMLERINKLEQQVAALQEWVSSLREGVPCPNCTPTSDRPTDVFRDN